MLFRSVVGGFVQLPHAFGGHDFFNDFLSPIVPAVKHEDAAAAMKEYYLLGGTIIGLAIIYFITKKLFAVEKFDGEYSGIKKAMANKWYVDEIYDTIIVKPLDALGLLFKNIVEKSGIDGLVNGVGTFINYSSQRIRLVQNGKVGSYLLYMVISVSILFTVFWNQEVITKFFQSIF